MYGVEWLIVLGLLGLAAGLGGGYLLARRVGAGGQRLRELEEQVVAAHQELEDYRHEVVTQFSETARKFQTLNDSYTDLHQQLARSSSILCGEMTGPLLAAPAGHQDLLAAGVREGRENVRSGGTEDVRREAAEGAGRSPAEAQTVSQPTPAATAAGPGQTPAAADPITPAAAGEPGVAAEPPAHPSAAAGPPSEEEEPPTLRERVERSVHEQEPAAIPSAAPEAAPASGGALADAAPAMAGETDRVDGSETRRPGGKEPHEKRPAAAEQGAEAGPAEAAVSVRQTSPFEAGAEIRIAEPGASEAAAPPRAPAATARGSASESAPGTGTATEPGRQVAGG